MDNEWIWWKHGVIYQIYPRSFHDTNGDGIGDIPGIIRKLDYLENLNIDGIWISPINVSPMFDFGYDINDYYAIDPVFGTNGDFETLIKEAHKRNIRIIMDIVLNHTSHLHPWFVESRASRDNGKSGWYIWHDGKKGKPPNNWMGAFGGRGWEWEPRRRQFYMHSFLKEQPDLNWRNEAMKKAAFQILTYWMDMGVDGFRLDVINYFTKDSRFRSNPFAIGPNLRPYDLQEHIFDRNQEENHLITRAMRKVTDAYKDRMLVGEVYAPTPDPELSASYLGDGTDELHLAFNFSFMYTEKWHAETFYRVIRQWYDSIPEKGWPCNVLSNHDKPRSRTRFGGGKDSDARARVAAAFLLTVKGTPFIYYGEEIGMEDGKIKKKEIHDPIGKRYWPINKGRDPARTPMLWSAASNAGFSGASPWLPLNNGWERQNVDAQEKDGTSILQFYKKLLRVRKEKKPLMFGEWVELNHGKENFLSYERRWSGERVLVLLNFARTGCTAAIPPGTWTTLLSTHGRQGVMPGSEVKLAPYEVVVAEYKL
ncbi:MAG: alpha-glucosidase [Spirochaetales bacterium]|nr:alpha-glucosidase [Spirochaetales bacterium]